MRGSVFSGIFYPAEINELRELVKSYFLQTPPFKKNTKAIIAPHAGYDFCGKQLAEAYNSLRNTYFETAVILGPSHQHYFKGYSIYNGAGYQTPFGDIKINQDYVRKLRNKNKNINYREKAHRNEHSIEVQLPFLFKINPLVNIVPIITGDNEMDSLKQIAEDLLCVIDREKTVIITSTDFSHFFSSKKAAVMDMKAVNLILKQDTQLLYEKQQTKEIQLCGIDATIILLEITKLMKLSNVKHFSYTHSGEVTGQENSVVGYNSLCVYE
jgi:MEMO1 family protein